ncbi:MAG TPA: heme utilization cystosolic carrier protein HutX [Rhodobacteraceae bacterium]|nr:heme utilization cystosolic carrier protein HutX [Paracoccaceae bacterium]
MTMTDEAKTKVKNALAETPGAVLEQVAKENGVTVADVVSCLLPEQVRTISGDKFEAVMTEISTWGEITFIVATNDVIFEAKGEVPTGSVGRGFYNLHGKPIGGHLNLNNCASISFVSRPLFTSDTHSVQFYNHDGGCMFKIYLGRDADRKLIPEQVATFKAYREKMAG